MSEKRYPVLTSIHFTVPKAVNPLSEVNYECKEISSLDRRS